MDKFDKHKYNLRFRQQTMKEKKKAQFNTDLDYDEKKELDELLNRIGMSKADFIRDAKIRLEKRLKDDKISTKEASENFSKYNKKIKEAIEEYCRSKHENEK